MSYKEMSREEAIKHLTELLPHYEPEIYAKDTLHKRQAIQFAIEALNAEKAGKVDRCKLICVYANCSLSDTERQELCPESCKEEAERCPDEYGYIQALRSEVYAYLNQGYLTQKIEQFKMRNGVMDIFEKYKVKESGKLSTQECPKCHQIPVGQGGEYPCDVCGIPLTHDRNYSEDVKIATGKLSTSGEDKV